jgi:hypothetical protein
VPNFAAGGSVGGGNRSGTPFGSLPFHMRAQRPAAPARRGFGPTDGPMIPRGPGYAAGGTPPAGPGQFVDPASVPDDGVVDNQTIAADEGEAVLQRAAAEVLGPEILAALNSPEMAAMLAPIIQQALATVDAGSQDSGMGGRGGGRQGMETPGGTMPADRGTVAMNQRGERVLNRPQTRLGLVRAGMR